MVLPGVLWPLGENLGDERKLLGELLMELKLEKQFYAIREKREERSSQGDGGSGSEARTLWKELREAGKSGIQCGPGPVKAGQVGTGGQVTASFRLLKPKAGQFCQRAVDQCRSGLSQKRR